MTNKNLGCPLCSSKFSREINCINHIIWKHDKSPSGAKAILLNTLNKFEEVTSETGTTGRERFNRSLRRATTGADQGRARLSQLIGR